MSRGEKRYRKSVSFCAEQLTVVQVTQVILIFHIRRLCCETTSLLKKYFVYRKINNCNRNSVTFLRFNVIFAAIIIISNHLKNKRIKRLALSINNDVCDALKPCSFCYFEYFLLFTSMCQLDCMTYSFTIVLV